MMENNLGERAQASLKALSSNSYPGRGIIIGASDNGDSLIQAYWIMGRSPNSRNRVFVQEQGRLMTRPLDPAKMENPELVIYTAMDTAADTASSGAGGAPAKPWHVLSNGDHTDTITEALNAGHCYPRALRTRNHEPDGPHFTPRIAGAIHAATGQSWLGILKADPDDSSRSLRQFFEFEALPAGFGWGITTYQGDGNPLPSYSGEPRLYPLGGTPDEILNLLWDHLDSDNRISLALKVIQRGSGASDILIRNKYA